MGLFQALAAALAQVVENICFARFPELLENGSRKCSCIVTRTQLESHLFWGLACGTEHIRGITR